MVSAFTFKVITRFVKINFFLIVHLIMVSFNIDSHFFNFEIKFETFYTWGKNRKPNSWFFWKNKNTVYNKKIKKSGKNFFGFLVLTNQLRYRQRRFHFKIKDNFKSFIFKRKFLCTQFCMGKQRFFFKFCNQALTSFNFNISLYDKLFYLFLLRPAYTLLFLKFANWLPVSNLLIKYGYISINGIKSKNRNSVLKVFDILNINLKVVFYLKKRLKSWLFRANRIIHRNFELCLKLFCFSVINYKISDHLFFTKSNYLSKRHLKFIN